MNLGLAPRDPRESELGGASGTRAFSGSQARDPGPAGVGAALDPARRLRRQSAEPRRQLAPRGAAGLLPVSAWPSARRGRVHSDFLRPSSRSPPKNLCGLSLALEGAQPGSGSGAGGAGFGSALPPVLPRFPPPPSTFQAGRERGGLWQLNAHLPGFGRIEVRAPQCPHYLPPASRPGEPGLGARGCKRAGLGLVGFPKGPQ